MWKGCSSIFPSSSSSLSRHERFKAIYGAVDIWWYASHLPARTLAVLFSPSAIPLRNWLFSIDISRERVDCVVWPISHFPSRLPKTVNETVGPPPTHRRVARSRVQIYHLRLNTHSKPTTKTTGEYEKGVGVWRRSVRERERKSQAASGPTDYHSYTHVCATATHTRVVEIVVGKHTLCCEPRKGKKEN